MNTGRTIHVTLANDPGPQAKAAHERAHQSIWLDGVNDTDLETLRVTWYRECWRCPGSRN